MIRIIRMMSTMSGHEITVIIDGIECHGKTYFDFDGHDKVIINGKKYELFGLSYIREV